MTRLTLVTGFLTLGLCTLPAGVVLGFAMLVPNDGRRWVCCFVALAVALIATSYGPDWIEGWQRRRRAQVRVRAALCREAGERRAAR
ncbi:MULTISPECIES: hypothetical protein [Kitasatospora]|uniref:Uncharacterized protein n=1 Tax=Kitasatospora setae (strain ATCC 33774 / DSM 43861 / JCM 3304 / KCC A-0304 / NBRC 14216 / KM-6054) TaxID=452652 RepID=E4N5S6_KITSK|nr:MULTISPECIES: hypothetical protein [Kitasatospora]BAJ26557.1 hypothetical protein KSE_07170 [Kitasatospora setae KM-6054]